MGASVVIKKINRKGLRLVELLSHGYIRIDGALLTYNRWKIAFDKITIPKNISIKKKKQYFEVIDQLHEYYLDWRNDPEAAEVKFKKAEAEKAKKIADAKAAKAKKIAKEKAEKAKKTIDSKVEKSTGPPIDVPGPSASGFKTPTAPKGTPVNLKDLKKAGEAKKPVQNHTDPVGPNGPHASTMEKDPDGLI